MRIAGFGKTEIRYDMFDIVRNAEEARRLSKCERIYHRGQTLAWDGKDILGSLLAEHGAPQIEPDKKEPLKRVFAIILWGELAAWKISAQLADRLVPLEAKMAATSQAHDEARHFYVMHDYLKLLDYVPERMDRAPQALLDLVLNTDNLAYKILGMQLMIETIALTIFQTVRELEVEPIITELMKYYEKDEARHVGLGMQYLPSLMQDMNKREVSALSTFQVKLLTWALWELKLLEKDFAVLGIDPRTILDRGRRKQLGALHEAFDALGVDLNEDRNIAASTLKSITEIVFPTDATKDRPMKRVSEAWRAFWDPEDHHDATELDEHERHEIRVARASEPRAVAPSDARKVS